MKKKSILALLAAGIISLTSCTHTSTYVAGTIMSNPSDGLTTKERDNTRGLGLTDTIWGRFYDKEDELIYNYYPYRNDEAETASVWHFTSMFSLMNRMLSLNPTNKTLKSRLETLTNDFGYYQENRSDYTVYAVNRGLAIKSVMPGPNTNVYDDNEWITREYLKAYETTSDEAYLTKAKDVAKYIMTGWDSTINTSTGKEWGGIYWGPYYTSKNTCSNAPFVWPLVRLYELTNDSSYLDFAKKVYSYSYNHFRKSNALYGDLIGSERDSDGNTISEGTLDETEYTYNTGTMISAGAALYKATKDVTYLNQAKETAAAAFDEFANGKLVDGVYQFPVSTTLWFNVQLFQGFLDLYMEDNTTGEYLDKIQSSIDFCYNNYLYDGSLPCNWVLGWLYGVDKDQYKDVMDDVANAETFALLAQYQQLKGSAE